ncbi:MAG TPA: dienelactone hydrolase family protein [Terriglobales bacterium]|jgi:carboxymethylenebutenolidase|nr:dienelactone hydrolase family protein [Terriglobales bacterium]
MERKKASDFDPQLLGLFQKYVHGAISRREFLDGAAKFAVGGLTAMALWEMLRPNYAWAQQVPKDDKRIRAEYTMYPSPNGNSSKGIMRGLLARPASGDKFPVVVVVHENRGLNPYIEDVARRLAVAGFMALAPDALWPLGGYPSVDKYGTEADEKAAEMFKQLNRTKMAEDFVAAAEFLIKHPQSTGKLGAVGFCFGGDVVNQLAVRVPQLAAGVPFYGVAPATADVPKIKAAMLLNFAELDPRVLSKWPEYEAALKANGIRYEAYIYPKTHHGFHNDTTPRYDEAAAKLAWQRTIDHFNKYLK